MHVKLPAVPDLILTTPMTRTIKRHSLSSDTLSILLSQDSKFKSVPI